MDDANRIKPEGTALAVEVPAATGMLRRKPGPRPKIHPRSEKESCRLTKDEKAERRAYCKKYGIKPADLLRASYLAANVTTGKDKIIIDTAQMLHELQAHTGKLASEGKPVLATELDKISGIIGIVLKKLMLLVPLAVCTGYFLLLFGPDVVAQNGNGIGDRYELAWLLGCFTGIAIDLALLPIVRPYQRKLDLWIAKGLCRLVLLVNKNPRDDLKEGIERILSQ